MRLPERNLAGSLSGTTAAAAAAPQQRRCCETLQLATRRQRWRFLAACRAGNETTALKMLQVLPELASAASSLRNQNALHLACAAGKAGLVEAVAEILADKRHQRRRQQEDSSCYDLRLEEASATTTALAASSSSSGGGDLLALPSSSGGTFESTCSGDGGLSTPRAAGAVTGAASAATAGSFTPKGAGGHHPLAVALAAKDALSGNTPLHCAAARGDVSLVQQLLLCWGADAGDALLSLNRMRSTPLHLAAQSGSLETAELLMYRVRENAVMGGGGGGGNSGGGHGGDVSSSSSTSGGRADELAALAVKAYVNQRNALGATPLHTAVSSGQVRHGLHTTVLAHPLPRHPHFVSDGRSTVWLPALTLLSPLARPLLASCLLFLPVGRL